MAIRVGINGFGRIGRLVFPHSGEPPRASSRSSPSTTSPTPRPWPCCSSTTAPTAASRARSSNDEENIIVNGKKIPVLKEKDPAKLPWKDLEVDVVLESTGVSPASKNADKGKAGYDTTSTPAPRRSCSAPRPRTTPDLTCVLGVNDDQLTPEMKCISNASCTTNCLAPMAKVLHDKFGIVKGLMTTVHAYTNDQRLLDLAARQHLSRSRGRHEHHSDEHRRREGGRRSDSGAEGQAHRHFAPRAESRRQRHRPDGRCSSGT